MWHRAVIKSGFRSRSPTVLRTFVLISNLVKDPASTAATVDRRASVLLDAAAGAPDRHGEAALYEVQLCSCWQRADSPVPVIDRTAGPKFFGDRHPMETP
jgi:hypothetical protein